MKLILSLSIIAYCYADKLDRAYLPPINAASSGGTPGELIAPVIQSNAFEQGLPVSGRQSESDEFDISSNKDGLLVNAENSVDAALFGSNVNPVTPSVNDYESLENNSPSGSDISAVGAVGSHQSTEFSSGNQYLPPASQSSPSSYKEGFGQEVQGVQENKQERPQAAADRIADTLKYNNVNEGKFYAYNYETSNGISGEESGVAINGVRAQGGFAYTGDDGKFYSVSYTADENGYQPLGEHLPTPHPIPEEILISIEKNAKAAAAGTQEGAYIPEEYESDAYYQSKPDQDFQGSFSAIENNEKKQVIEENNENEHPIASLDQQYNLASTISGQVSLDQNRPLISSQGQEISSSSSPSSSESVFNRNENLELPGNRPSAAQFQQYPSDEPIASGLNPAVQNGQDEESFDNQEQNNQMPSEGLFEQLSQSNKNGYQYTESQPAFQPIVSEQASLDQFHHQVSSQGQKMSSPSSPSSFDSVFNGNQNLESSGNSPSADKLQPYSSGQSIASSVNLAVQNGPNESQNKEGSFNNQGQQNQMVPKEQSGQLNENKGNGYQYVKPKPAFQPIVSGQASLDQFRPQVSSQGQKISSPSSPSSFGSVFNGNQNFKPSGSSPSSSDKLQQYSSGQSIASGVNLAVQNGPNESQNKEGSFDNQSQQNQMVPKEQSGQLNQNKGNGYQYVKPKPAFQPNVSGQASLDQFRPQVPSQGQKMSSPSSPSSFGSVFNGNQNLEPSGNSPSADKLQQYSSGQSFASSVNLAVQNGPNESQNKEGSFDNQDQQNQMVPKEQSGQLNQNKGNGYQYIKPKPAFQSIVSGQASLDQFRPQVSSQRQKISLPSSPSSFGSVFNGNQNFKPSGSSPSSSDKFQQYSSGQSIASGVNLAVQNGPNESQNKEGSFDNQGQQNQMVPKEQSGQLNQNKGNGYQYIKPKPAFQPIVSGQASLDQFRPQVSSQGQKISSPPSPSSFGSVFNGNQNFKPSGSSPSSSDKFQQYSSGQSIASGVNLAVQNGPNESQNKEGSFDNQDQQNQMVPKEQSGQLNQKKGNGYQYIKPKPAFQPIVSGQASLDQFRPQISSQGQKISSPSSPSSVFKGNQNLQPNQISSIQGYQYQPEQAFGFNKPNIKNSQSSQVSQYPSASTKPSFNSVNKQNKFVANPSFGNFNNPSQNSQHQQIDQTKRKPAQGAQFLPDNKDFGANKVGQSGFSSKPVSAPYYYNKPSPSFITGRPSQTSQSSGANQDRSEKFGGPRQPPSFSPEEGYKY